MIWLESALAFAITMLVFSTIVSIIVESAHRVMGLRHAGLRAMLEKVFDEIVWPRASTRLSASFESRGLKVDLNQIREQFLETMTQNRGHIKMSKLMKLARLRGDRIDRLSSEDFMQRLAETEIGQAIAQGAEKTAGDVAEIFDTVLEDLCTQYDSYCDGISNYFQRRARLTSVVIALALAFIVNIDAVRLFQSYLQNDNLRSSIIAESEKIQAGARQQLVQVTNNENANKQKSVNNDSTTEFEIQTKALQKNNEELKTYLSDLKNKGVPIGWEYYPHGSKATSTEIHWGWNLIAWLLSTTLAGLMIGLGAPFWFDAIGGLTSILGIARKSEPASTPDTMQNDSNKHSGPINAFKIAYKSIKHTQAINSSRPPLLLPSGDIDHGEVRL